MASLAFNKFYAFSQDLGRKVHNLHTDTLKIMLTNRQPVVTDTTYSGMSDLSTGAGYTSGGITVTSQSYVQTLGIAKLIGTGAVITATGSLGPFEWEVLYNVTAGGNVIGWWDYGSAVTLLTGQTYTIGADLTNGILQLG